MKSMCSHKTTGAGRQRQQGAAAVEFALVALFILFPLLFAITEFGRMLYVYNAVQEATRNLARQAVVAAPGTSNSVVFRQTHALFGGSTLIGSIEVSCSTSSCTNLVVEYLREDFSNITTPPADQATECVDNPFLVNPTTGCVAYVRTAISNVTYRPIAAGFLPSLEIPLPASSVIMRAESMGAS
ncbi:MAG: TadE/TadG family type IV pilus assembly protein [Rhodocyclaceae bacterium]|nr:TadE/TadG family type IV pilus assembly protein [Rhodocyclaceae bacterium]